MRKYKMNNLNACLCAAVCLSLFSSCKDDYIYDDEAPAWLGENIYEYLEHEGQYTSYLALVKDLGYEETLRRTGSKTLFPATDEAFANYFRANGMNGSGAEFVHGLPASQKRYLFNTTMLNMAYLSNMLANVTSDADGLSEGTAVRRTSSATLLDTVPYVSYADMPKTSFWKRFERKGGTFLADNGNRMSVFFTPQYFSRINLTESDWNVISKGWGTPWDASGFYVNGIHVQAQNKDVTCKNGYLHLADGVVTPLPNMAEAITSTPEVSQFAELLDMFSFPYYDGMVQSNLAAAYGGVFNEDSTVFVKRYFNQTDFNSDPEGKVDINGYGTLLYDPASHAYGGNTDMAMMLVPTNEAMQEYWTSEEGKFLADKFPQWDSVYTKVISAFLQNHQQRSFSGALPHNWDIVADNAGYELGITENDIVKTIPANNGLIYVTNKVFAPVDYQSVYAPVLISDSTTIMSPAIKNDVDNDYNLKYHFYLRSLDSRYNLLVPTDQALADYRDPITWAIWANEQIDNREIWSFRVYMGRVVADVYAVNEDGAKGELLRTLDDETGDERNQVNDRLQDLLDMHIVVANDEAEPLSGYLDEGVQPYFLTKGGAVLQAEGVGGALSVKGLGDVEMGWPSAHVIALENGDPARYEMTNGRTFFINRILQDSYKSVYYTMADVETHEAYAAFYQLLQGDERVWTYFEEDDDVEPIFDLNATTSSSGLGPIVTSFNNFRYTVLVPTKEALDRAFAEDPELWTWEQIAAETDAGKKKEKTLYLLNFLRYHFVDGILPLGEGISYNGSYATAARDENNHFVYLNVSGNGSQLTFTSENTGTQAHVVTEDESNCNVFTRDYIVNNSDYKAATQIIASSHAVIHLVDHVVDYR